MCAASLRVLIFPYRSNPHGVVEYALLQSAGEARWQPLGGIGAPGETPLQAARRLAFTAGRIEAEAPFTQLELLSVVPVADPSGRPGWGKTNYVIPQFCFGVRVIAGELALSPAYAASRWLDFSAASRLLETESSRTALWELTQRLQGESDDTSPPRAATEPLPEPVLVLGSELGVITLFGQRQSPGSWRFYLSTDENSLAEHPYPAPRRRASRPADRVSSWPAAVGLLSEIYWICLYPLQVHPEFRHWVWEAVVDQGKLLDLPDVERWLECLERWYKRCFEE